MSTTPTPTPAARSLQVLALALVSAPLVLLVAVLIVLPIADATPPSTLMVLALLVPVAVAWLAAETIGFRPTTRRTDALAPAEEMGVHQSLTVLRFAITEVPLILALALSFVLDHGPWPYLVVLAPALAVLAWEVWPSRRVVSRTARALEAPGGRSSLPAAFGHA